MNIRYEDENDKKTTAAFSRIYEENAWGTGSGLGSLPENCFQLIGYLQFFLKKYSIRSLIDYGCGDWQWMQFVNLTEVKYRGVDVVSSVIEENQTKYSLPNVTFTSGSISSNIEETDLAFLKDVLMHLPNAEVKNILDEVLKKSKYVIAINSTGMNRYVPNTDIEVGGFRLLDLTLPPFNYKVLDLLRYSSTTDFDKVVQLVS
jgi:hypothetical protein